MLGLNSGYHCASLIAKPCLCNFDAKKHVLHKFHGLKYTYMIAKAVRWFCSSNSSLSLDCQRCALVVSLSHCRDAFRRKKNENFMLSLFLVSLGLNFELHGIDLSMGASFEYENSF